MKSEVEEMEVLAAKCVVRS